MARHLLQSMVTNPRPTRAEMTDVANAVLDGAHCMMLSAETAIGTFPVESVSTMAAIVTNAEAATNFTIIHMFIRDMTAKPFTTEEGVAAAVAKTPRDGAVNLIVVMTENGRMPNLIGKFKSSVPIMVVTSDQKVANCCKIVYSQYPHLVDTLGDRREMKSLVQRTVEYARANQLYSGGSVAIVHGANEPDCEIDPVMQIWTEAQLAT
eukprot:scaffold654422_cov43-Prasinocladus_malaysianus.AAC.1